MDERAGCDNIMKMTCTISGLMAETEYSFKVGATNAVEMTISDDTATATTDRSNTAPEIAAEIADVTVTHKGDGMTHTDTTAAADYFSDADAADATLSIIPMSSDDTIATASINDAGMIVVTGVSVGEATVTVTATDTGNMAGKLDVSQTFKVTVTSGNRAPESADMLPDTALLTVGGDAMGITLTGSFTDADEDTLSYTAASSDDTIATATVSDDGSMLTIAAVAAGTATVTVIADDMDGGTAMHDIAVSVNAVPMAIGSIDAVSLVAGTTSEVDVSGNFNDTEGDTLTYTAASSAETVAMASVDGSMVTISGVAAGMATITVTATDASGAMATQDITVTVDAANVAPMPTDDPGMQLPTSVDVTVGEDDEEITLTGSFTDADGDTLTYSAMSDKPAIAIATVSDDNTTLTIVAVAGGTATVTVTATDPDGLSATASITVNVTQPLTAPVVNTVNPVGSGIVAVAWQSVPAATEYIIAAVNLNDGDDYSANAYGAESTSGSVLNLTKGEDYLIFVVALDAEANFKLSKSTQIEAE